MHGRYERSEARRDTRAGDYERKLQTKAGEGFGADKISMGTDYPYDMAESDPIGHLAWAGLDAATVAAIAGGKLRRLLNL